MKLFPWRQLSTSADEKPDRAEHTRRILETANLASRLAALAEQIRVIDERSAGESGR